jgi:hypothetical protein
MIFGIVVATLRNVQPREVPPRRPSTTAGAETRRDLATGPAWGSLADLIEDLFPGRLWQRWRRWPECSDVPDCPELAVLCHDDPTNTPSTISA